MSVKPYLPADRSDIRPHISTVPIVSSDGHRVPENTGRNQISSADGPEKLTGYYPAISAATKCCAVCGGLLLGGNGFSWRYGIVTYHRPAAVPHSRSHQRGGTEKVPVFTGLHPRRRCPGYAEKAATGFWTGHPDGNRYLRRQYSGLSSITRRTIPSVCAGRLALDTHYRKDRRCRKIHPGKERPGLF